MVINNSRYYNDSLAYDFELFMPKSQPKTAEVVKMPQKKKRQTRAKAKRKISGVTSLVLIIVCLVGIVCMNIALRVEITETNAAILKAKSELSALSGEETRLDIELERMISYKNLKEAARSLGMKKTDKSQIVYINVNDVDKAVDSNGNILTAEKE